MIIPTMTPNEIPVCDDSLGRDGRVTVDVVNAESEECCDPGSVTLVSVVQVVLRGVVDNLVVVNNPVVVDNPVVIDNPVVVDNPVVLDNPVGRSGVVVVVLGNNVVEDEVNIVGNRVVVGGCSVVVIGGGGVVIGGADVVVGGGGGEGGGADVGDPESVCVVLGMLDRVGREGITLSIIIEKGTASSMAEQWIELRNCRKFCTSVSARIVDKLHL